MHILMGFSNYHVLEQRTVIAYADGTLAKTWTNKPSELGVFSVQAYPTLRCVFCAIVHVWDAA